MWLNRLEIEVPWRQEQLLQEAEQRRKLAAARAGQPTRPRRLFSLIQWLAFALERWYAGATVPGTVLTSPLPEPRYPRPSIDRRDPAYVW